MILHAGLLTLVFLAGGRTDDPVRVLATFDDPGVRPTGIVAELLELPPAISAPDFARRLVEAEGLSAWDGKGPVGAQGDMVEYLAIFSGDGRNVRVYFPRSWRTHPPTAVCRIRSDSSGMSDANGRANRWCSVSLGFEPPETTGPLIVQEP